MHDTAEVDAPFAPLKPSEIGRVAEPASEGEIVLPVPPDAPPIGLHREGTDKRGGTVKVRISAPFEIFGRGRDPDGRAWGRFLRWRDPDGRMHEKFVADEALHHEPAALCGLLAAEGLDIVRDQQRAFASYLSAAQPPGRVTVVARTGWHAIEGETVFILPGEYIGPKHVGRVWLDGAAHGPYEMKGTLAEWREGVATLVTGHAIPMLAISTALAGPLLHLAGLEGGGVHLFGQSSRGKTTCLQAAGSVWGRGGTPGFVRAWRATSNGLEGAAAQSSDTVMILDELGMVDAREAAQAFYGLANGAGKQRAGRDGSPREPKSWRVLFLSSGELPVQAKLLEAPGRKAHAGQLVRMLDVPADRGAGFGVFDNGGPNGDAAALAKSIKLAAMSKYGTAGPAFVRKLIDEGVTSEDARELIRQFALATIPAKADGQVERAAGRFGLISAAGELAARLNIVPWPAGAACDAAAWALARWIELRGGTQPAEARQAVEIASGCSSSGTATRDSHPCRRSPGAAAGGEPGRLPQRATARSRRVVGSAGGLADRGLRRPRPSSLVARTLAGVGHAADAGREACSARSASSDGEPVRAYVVTAAVLDGASRCALMSLARAERHCARRACS